MTITATAKLASPKQQAFALDLLATRVHQFPAFPADRAMTALEARFVIDNLIAAPRVAPAAAAAAPAAADVRPGFYVTEGRVIKIVKNKTNDRFSGRELIGGHWHYEFGLDRVAAAGHRVTVEEAAAFGGEHGSCMICGRELTVKASQDRGIGPDCYKRLQANG